MAASPIGRICRRQMLKGREAEDCFSLSSLFDWIDALRHRLESLFHVVEDPPRVLDFNLLLRIHLRIVFSG